MQPLLRLLSFLLGFVIVNLTLLSAIRTFVLPRSANDWLTRQIFRHIRRLFNLRMRWVRTYEDRDRVMALYAPISLLCMPIVWLCFVGLGYTFMFRAVSAPTWYEAFTASGSSMLTLGIVPMDSLPKMLLAFSAAALGLILVALLISYLPTIYSAFSRREVLVAMLEVRAGSPPSPVEMFTRLLRLGRLDYLHQFWEEWERWFVEVDETHTSLAVLSFFRSPQPQRSWITAAGAVLDSAAIAVSTLDIPRDAQADLCIRAGYIALRRIADFFSISYDANPKPDDPISIRREEFDEACSQLVKAGVPVKADRDQAWRDYVGWRVNYDLVLLALAALTMAPYAPWVSDRSRPHALPKELKHLVYGKQLPK